MWIVLCILACIFTYALVAGVTYSLTKLFMDDGDMRVITAIIWPIGLPWAIAWIIGHRVTEFGTDYLEAQKEKRREKRYRIAQEAREREREIQAEVARLDAEEAEHGDRFCVRQQGS